MDHRQLARNFADLFTLDGQMKADVRSEMLWELEYTPVGTKRDETNSPYTLRTHIAYSRRFFRTFPVSAAC